MTNSQLEIALNSVIKNYTENAANALQFATDNYLVTNDGLAATHQATIHALCSIRDILLAHLSD